MTRRDCRKQTAELALHRFVLGNLLVRRTAGCGKKFGFVYQEVGEKFHFGFASFDNSSFGQVFGAEGSSHQVEHSFLYNLRKTAWSKKT